MNMGMKRWVSWGLIVCLMPWMTGCDSLTGRLWSSDIGQMNYQAAAEPALNLSQTPDQKDVLVQYDEVRSKDAKIQRRAYLLFANDKIIAAGKKPQFMTPAMAAKLQSLPLPISYITNLSTVGDLTLRVVLQEDKHHFTLTSNGRAIGTFQLPDYMQHNTFVQVLLTPATVTGDVVIAAAIAAAVLGVLYLKSQN